MNRWTLSISVLGIATATLLYAAGEKKFDPVAEVSAAIGKMRVQKGDWPEWGGSNYRNNTPDATAVPTEWDIEKKQNIKWAAPVGSQTYGNPVIANGKVYVGTNNGSGYVKKYPPNVDLGCLIAFDEATGKFLWQHSSEKLPTGRVHDWPQQGICCAPLVDGKRLWYVTSRGEVVCLDTEGFHDNENDGPFTQEAKDLQTKADADVVWKLDMMKDLGISQHNMCSCSVTAAGDFLFVITGNGVDESHINIPAPQAPSFLMLNKNTGEVIWQDSSPGLNILHGQWSSPTFGILGGVPQVLMGGGDGWLYSFLAEPTGDKKPRLLWKFDCNPKESKYLLGGRADRNHIIGTPVIYDDLVYVAVGEDPEHNEGVGHLWCIDPTKRGDVSPELVYNKSEPTKPIPHKRIQACEPDKGDFAKDNPSSALVWHFGVPYKSSMNGKEPAVEPSPDSGKAAMHRTCGTVGIKDDILYIADFSGFLHCLNAKNGKHYWSHDMLSACWASPLIAGGHVYIGDEDGDVTILKHNPNPGDKPEIVREINMNNSVYTTPVVANGVLYIANRTHVFAIGGDKKQ